jgi:DNA-binding MarR family transcriptional regulator
MEVLSKYRMTPEQWQVMVKLWRGGALCQRDIADLIVKDKHSVSRIVRRLERNGWVEKIDSLENGRYTLIQPTEKGWAIQNEVTGKLIDHFKRFFISFGKSNENQLLFLLKMLMRIIENKEF